MTTTPVAISQMVAWCAANEGHFAYSENSGRLDPDHSGYTDCSGLARYLYLKFAKITIGSYTGDECKHGTLVTESRTAARAGSGMLPGDLIFYRWESRSLGSDPWDHVNLYVGGGKVQNHGGPGHGPVVQSLQSNVDNAVAVMVRRYITPINEPTDTLPTEAPLSAAEVTAINAHTDKAVADLKAFLTAVLRDDDGHQMRVETLVKEALADFAAKQPKP